MRRSSIFWGGLLILFGIFLLLNNLGIISVSVWTLFWPLALIVVGLWVLVNTLGRRASAAEELVLPLKGVESAHVRIEYGAGELFVDGRTAPDELLNGTFSEGVDYRTREKGETLEVELKPPGDSWLDWGKRRRWQIGLNRDVPLHLDVRTGASASQLNLTDTHVARLTLKTGASDSRVQLPALARETRVDVETGAASVELEVPPGVAARIRAEAGLAEVQVDRSRFPRAGGMYESPDFETAVHRVDISIKVGIGSVRIV